MTELPARTENQTNNKKGYWVPTLWVLSIVVVGIAGFYLGNPSSNLSASFQEAWQETLGIRNSNFDQVVDTRTFEPRTDIQTNERVISKVIYAKPTNTSPKPSISPLTKANTATSTQEQVIEEDLAIGGGVDLCALTDQDPTHEILINEVSWAGKEGNSSEEWIELFNTQEEPINLEGWQLIDQESSIAVFFGKDDQIDDFFLLRRILKRDDPNQEYLVGDAVTDKTYTGVIQNSDEALYLFDNECNLIDQVTDVGSDWGNIGGNASPEYRTAERTDEKNWHTYSGEIEDGIRGTPRRENSEAKEIEEEEKKVTTKKSSSSSSSSSSSNNISSNNNSWCSQDDLNEPTQIVLINEIAWAGNASSTSQEWIELKTDVGGGLSLSNWQLLDKDEEIKIRFNEEKIEDYILLGKILSSDDLSGIYHIGDVVVDKNYTGTLQNNDETLRLFDASCNLVDEVVEGG